MEQFVDGYAGYSVSDDGRVYSTKYGRKVELKLSEHKGYRRVALSQNNKRRIFPVHCLVAKAFIPNPEGKPFVNHIDGNKRNNHVANLQWCTAKENQRHAYDVLNIRNGKTGYTYAKLYPNEELRNRLVELGVPRWRHNLAELGEMLPEFYVTRRVGKKPDGASWWEATKNFSTAAMLPKEQYADTEADARAKMLIYLLENGLLKLT